MAVAHDMTEARPPAGPAPSLRPAGDHRCRVIANAAVSARYAHLVLEAPPLACTARAGQFFHLRCPAPPGEGTPFFRRPMSVYQARPDRGQVEFLYKVAGHGTRGMAALRPGEPFDILGPLGNGFALDPGWRRIVVVARGVGLATLAPLAQDAAALGIGVTSLLSARTPADLLCRDVMEAAGAEVIAVTDSEGTSDPAAVEQVLRTAIARQGAAALFTCGSNRLLTLCQRLAAELGLAGQVALEQQMACGLGMCLCCVRPIRRNGAVEDLRVCWDGPVFELQEALSW